MLAMEDQLARLAATHRELARSYSCFGKPSNETSARRLRPALLLAGCASNDIIDPHGYDQTGVASYYGAKHHGKRTASGERSTRIP
jgi:rare lipoprotein A (peptidoglycan hydrolase)